MNDPNKRERIFDEERTRHDNESTGLAEGWYHDIDDEEDELGGEDRDSSPTHHPRHNQGQHSDI